MATGTSAKWEKFFLDAGVPTTVASEYAIIFSDNRMRIDMLNELNKDILGDLGIKVMGDVLSILRHSKKVYAQYERVKAEEYEKRKTKEPPAKSKSAAVGSKSVAVAKKEIPTLKSLPKTPPNVMVKPSSKPIIGRKTLSDRFGQIESDVSAPKKSKDSATFTVTLGKTAKQKISKVVPEKPKVTVIPAQGKTLTAQGKTLTAQGKTVTSQGKTVTLNVFDRLGKSQPNKEEVSATKISAGSLKPLKSSRTPKPEAKAENSIFNRLGSPSTPPPLAGSSLSSTPTLPFSSSSRPPPLSGSQGIFRRLGPVGDRVSTPTASAVTVGKGRSSPFSNFTVARGDNTKSDSIRFGLSNSHSVLRPVKPVKPVIRTGTLAMDMEPSRVTKSVVPQPPLVVSKPKAKSVFDRLGN